MPRYNSLRLVSGLFAATLASLTVAPALADTPLVRPAIPADAKRVVLDAGNGVLSVKGTVLQLSAAIQIRDAQNRLVLSQSLNGRYPAAIKLDSYGAVWRVWLLSTNSN